MSGAPAADHVLAVLTLLARQSEPVTAGTVAARLGLPRSTTYRLLSILRDHGFVSHLADRQRYALGVAAYELGTAYQRQGLLQRIAGPPLRRLAAELSQHARLAVLHGTDVFFVIEERAPGLPQLVTDVGVRLPASVTASGLAILAELPAKQITALFPGPAALVQRDHRGPATPTELRRLLTDARTRGYAVEEGMVTPGLSTIARPVLDTQGHPVASVAVTYSIEIDHEVRERVVEAVVRVAGQLSDRLGGRTPA
ncbi:IclR family transcriptional regulator [Microlunatus speluncae]|uniref:IclR family transcriptional regulator n=1 Tax=Microlunatus speluncae TaxID=2594267 RepID=UPI0012663EBB|nr:IclR family transcriptional regulator [Microlunatus speluncae]